MTRNHMDAPGLSVFHDREPGDWPLDDDRPNEPPLAYSDGLALGVALGAIAGFILAWIPAGLIIWRLT